MVDVREKKISSLSLPAIALFDGIFILSRIPDDPFPTAAESSKRSDLGVVCIRSKHCSTEAHGSKLIERSRFDDLKIVYVLEDRDFLEEGPSLIARSELALKLQLKRISPGICCFTLFSVPQVADHNINTRSMSQKIQIFWHTDLVLIM